MVTGYREIATATPREILHATNVSEMHPGGVILDKDKTRDGLHSNPYEIRAGWAVGRISSTGLYRLCARTRLRAFASSGASSSDGGFTILPVDDASAFRVGDVITVGNDTGLTVTAIDYDSHLITVDDGAFAVADGDAVYAEDGSGVCVGFLVDTVNMYDQRAGQALHRTANVYTRATLNRAYLLGDLSAIIASNAPIEGIKIYDPSAGAYIR